jgi:mono/diheme cytochrome c family protein
VSERRGFWFLGLAAVLASIGFAISSRALAEPRPWASKVPPEAVKAVNPLPAGPDLVAAGKDVYTNTCLPCHGTAAQGDGPAAAFIKPKPKPLVLGPKLSLPDGVMFWVVSHGIDNTGMAAFNETLSEAERWQAIGYLHSLAQPDTTSAQNGATGTPPPTAVPAASPAASPAGESTAPAASTSPAMKTPSGAPASGTRN